MGVHYLEIVCEDIEATCALLEQIQGLKFGDDISDLGFAKVAKSLDGHLVGVRKLLGDHETPIIRPYLKVDDMKKAVESAEQKGAIIAYPPTRQGSTGTWAIFILNGIQHGLWST